MQANKIAKAQSRVASAFFIIVVNAPPGAIGEPSLTLRLYQQTTAFPSPQNHGFAPLTQQLEDIWYVLQLFASQGPPYRPFRDFRSQFLEPKSGAGHSTSAADRQPGLIPADIHRVKLLRTRKSQDRGVAILQAAAAAAHAVAAWPGSGQPSENRRSP